MTKNKGVRGPYHEWTGVQLKYAAELWTVRALLIPDIAKKVEERFGFRCTGPMIAGIAMRHRDKFPERSPFQRRSRASYGK